MCDSNVGVAKRLDLENISKELRELIVSLDEQASTVEVDVDVKKIQHIEHRLHELVK